MSNRGWKRELETYKQCRGRIESTLNQLREKIEAKTVGIFGYSEEGGHSYAVSPNTHFALQQIRDFLAEAQSKIGQSDSPCYFVNTKSKEVVLTFHSFPLAPCNGELPIDARLIILHSKADFATTEKAEIDLALQRLSELLTLIKHRYSVIWHRQARSTLVERQAKELKRIANHFSCNAQDSDSQLKTTVARKFLRILLHGMSLDYVAFISRDPSAPEFYTTIAEHFSARMQFTTPFRKRFHVFGQGMVGESIKSGFPFCQHNGSGVGFVSDLFANSEAPLELGEELAVAITRIIGSQVDDIRSIDGALICIRRTPLSYGRLYLSRDEQLHTQAVAESMARCFERIDRHETLNSEMSFSKDLCRIWQSKEPISDRLSYSLSLITDRLPFSRLLFSKVDGSTKSIVGLSCIGFTKDLLYDTVRSYDTLGEADSSHHDVLVNAYHSNWTDARVFPSSIDGKLNPCLDSRSATRQGVQNQLVVMVTSDLNGDPSGIILGEYDVKDKPISTGILRSFENYVRQLSAKYLLAQTVEFNARESQIGDEIASALMREFSSESEPVTSATQCLATLAEGLSSQRCILFLIDNERQEFMAFCSTGLTKSTVAATSFPLVSAAEQPLLNGSDLVGKIRDCVRSQQPLNCRDVSLFPIVTTASEPISSCKIVPILSLSRVVGVALLETTEGGTASRLSRSLQIRLERIAAVCLERTLQLRATRRLHRQLGSIEGLIHCIQSLDATNAASDTLVYFCARNKQLIDTLLRFICEYYDADHAVFYTPDNSVEWKTGCPEEFVSSIDNLNLSFRASCGQDPSKIVGSNRETFSVLDHSLRSAIVRAFRVLTSKNVLTDSRRSGHFDELLRDHITTEREKEAWAWIGFPIASHTASTIAFYGIICVMRKRKSTLDARTFGELDCRSASQIGSILGNGINHSTSVARYATGVRKVFRYFGHQVKSPLATATSLLEQLRQEMPCLSNESSTVGLEESVIEEIEHYARFASASVMTYLDYYSGIDKWSAEPAAYRLHDLFVELLNVLRRKSGGIQIQMQEISDDVLCNLDRNRMSVILHTLIENAIKACDESENLEKWIRITWSFNLAELVIKIEDNGVGLPKEVASVDLFAIDVSLFSKKSSGIGLALVRDILSGLPGSSIRLTNSDCGSGATATIRLAIAATDITTTETSNAGKS